MHSQLAKQLGLKIKQRNIGIDKRDCTSFKIFEIVIATLEEKNKEIKFCFFKNIFLLDTYSINIVLGIIFFILSNMKINFLKFKTS